jgi:hypothetical protein
MRIHGRILLDMLFSRLLEIGKNKLIDELENKIERFVQVKAAYMLSSPDFHIEKYIENNEIDFLFQVEDQPEVFFKKYSLYITKVSEDFDIACLEFTFFKEYILLRLIDKNDAFEVLEFGKKMISEIQSNFTARFLSQALKTIQKLHLESAEDSDGKIH